MADAEDPARHLGEADAERKVVALIGMATTSLLSKPAGRTIALTVSECQRGWRAQSFSPQAATAWRTPSARR